MGMSWATTLDAGDESINTLLARRKLEQSGLMDIIKQTEAMRAGREKESLDRDKAAAEKKYYEEVGGAKTKDAETRATAAEAKSAALEQQKADIEDWWNETDPQVKAQKAVNLKIQYKLKTLPGEATTPEMEPVMRVTRAGKMVPVTGPDGKPAMAPKGTHFTTEPAPQGGVSLVPLSDDAIAGLTGITAGTGHMPNFGRDATSRNRIWNNVFNPNSGHKPADVVQAGIDYENDRKARADIQTKSANLDAFGEAAHNDIQLFYKTLTTIPDLGAPVLNKPWRQARKELGDANIAKFEAVRNTVNKQVARMTNGLGSAILSDSAREQVNKLNDDSLTAQAYKAVVDAFVTEMTNMENGYHSQLDIIDQRIHDRGQPKPAATPAAPGTTPAAPAKVDIEATKKKLGLHY
jgi:hypothetical protein